MDELDELCLYWIPLSVLNCYSFKVKEGLSLIDPVLLHGKPKINQPYWIALSV